MFDIKLFLFDSVYAVSSLTICTYNWKFYEDVLFLMYINCLQGILMQKMELQEKALTGSFIRFCDRKSPIDHLPE